MTLLARNGVVGAQHWPLCRVWSEAEIVRRQSRRELASSGSVWHSAMAAVMGGKKGHAAFEKTIKGLNDG